MSWADRTLWTAACRRVAIARLVVIVAVALIAASGSMVAIIGFGPVSSTDGELRCSIAATTIDSLTATPSTAYVGETVTFTASASSTTSSQLTFTFFYDAYDYPYPTNNTESPYTRTRLAAPAQSLRHSLTRAWETSPQGRHHTTLSVSSWVMGRTQSARRSRQRHREHGSEIR